MRFRVIARFPRLGERGDVQGAGKGAAAVLVDAETLALLSALAAQVERIARADDRITGYADAAGHVPARRRRLTVARLLYLLARGQLECYVDSTTNDPSGGF